MVLASEPVLLVGVDVSAPFALRGGPPIGDYDEVRQSFANVLSDDEWELVDSGTDEDERIKRFRMQWSRKEAFAWSLCSSSPPDTIVRP